MYLAVAVVLCEVDGSFERFDSNLFASGEAECIVDAGSHTFADLFDGLESSVETQLHDVFAA